MGIHPLETRGWYEFRDYAVMSMRRLYEYLELAIDREKHEKTKRSENRERAIEEMALFDLELMNPGKDLYDADGKLKLQHQLTLDELIEAKKEIMERNKI